MEYLVGIALALVVSISATLIGLDRDRAFYPTVLLVIALLYDLFAVIGGSTQALIVESLVMTIFFAAAVLGFKGNPWFVVAGLFGHGVFDYFHGHLISNPGVPVWWPMFCLTYDVAAAAYLAWLLRRSSSPCARTRPGKRCGDLGYTFRPCNPSNLPCSPPASVPASSPTSTA